RTRQAEASESRLPMPWEDRWNGGDAVNEMPRHVRRAVRELSRMAYEEDLRRALMELAGHFDRWRRGEVDGFELADLIHRFHDGPARDLWKQYNYGGVEMN